MIWELSHRFDRECLPLADAHYNRQTPGSPQFVPPGSCVVLKAHAGDCVRAVWAVVFPQYVQHAWAGAWINSIFRNEGAGLSSDLIRQAIAATRFIAEEKAWGLTRSIVTFIDSAKVRHKRDPGRCYLKAGFNRASCWAHKKPDANCAACKGMTEGGLIALQIDPRSMPPRLRRSVLNFHW